MGESEHFVQFYEHDGYLISSVSAFVGMGLRAGDGAIVIATAAHREALEERLRKGGLDPDTLRQCGQYYPLDAAETLSQFMVEGVPDEDLFMEIVGTVVARAAQGGRHVRAFGEMVALLWADGNAAAAIRLEELWNNLSRVSTFSMFCAYPMAGFQGASNGQPFIHICRAHTRVIPAESYAAQTDADERLRAITLLQQKACSLEAEVTERKEVVQVLARRERELSDFLENATEAIHQVGPDGQILWANQAELDLLGYTAAEYIGRPIMEFHADAPVIADILERLKRGEKLKDYEARLTHKDGSVRHVSINSSGYWEEGRFVHSKCFTRDITERKRAAEILERTVVERTSELRETVADLEAFSYSIAHDLRAPLRSMEGFANIVVEECGETISPEARTYLGRITASAVRMDRLIQDVLTFSRVARTELTLEPVNLDHLVRGIVECYPTLQAPHADVVIQGRLPYVIGNAAALTQCFSNLLNNAVKFVARGIQPSVRVWAEVIPAPAFDPAGALRSPTPSAPMIRVCVQDNGIGITQEGQETIFGIFQQLNKGYDGTGIGLAIVKKAVERMGGRVGVHSEAGQGSTFWLELKRAEASAV